MNPLLNAVHNFLAVDGKCRTGVEFIAQEIPRGRWRCRVGASNFRKFLRWDPFGKTGTQLAGRCCWARPVVVSM